MYHQTLAYNDKTWAEFSTLEEAGARKITGENLKTGLGRVFNSKLGCIATPGSKCMVCMQPLLKL